MRSKKKRNSGKKQRQGLSGNPARRAEQLAEAPLVIEIDDRDYRAPGYILPNGLALGGGTRVGGKLVTRQELPPLRGSAATTVHQVKVTLYGSKPPIWRRLEIPSAMPLDELHEILQYAFGWDDFHLHMFETVCGEFTDTGRDQWSDAADERGVAFAQVAGEEKAKVVYMYDFGDDWRHDIVVESIHPAEPGVAYPRCTAGRRDDTPEEDSGGIWYHNANSDPEPFKLAELNDGLSPYGEVLVPADS